MGLNVPNTLATGRYEAPSGVKKFTGLKRELKQSGPGP